MQNDMFLARIEIHNGSNDDYQNLHNLLHKNGFSNYIRATDGLLYRLPRALYLIEYNGAITNVHNSIQQIIATLGKTSEIFVVKYTESLFSGLSVVKG